MIRCLHLLRGWIAWWRPKAGRFLVIRKGIAFVATMPLFLLMSISLLIYTRLFGTIHIETTLPNGQKFKCQLPDVVQLCIFLFGVWEPDLSTFIRNRLSIGDTFVDIGSHVGYYTLLASRCVGSNGTVVAVEASPTIFQQLQENLQLNGVSNVRTLNIAAARESGSLRIYRGPNWNLGWSTTVDRKGLHLECEVPALPLDEFLTPLERRNVRLIKVDVEGTERELFDAMLKMVPESRSDLEIMIELSPLWWKGEATTIEEALCPFLDAGFHVYVIENNYAPWRYLWPDSVCPPHRARKPIKSWIGQVDVILSRVDQDELEASVADK